MMNQKKRRDRWTAVLSVILVMLCALAVCIYYEKEKNPAPEQLASEYISDSCTTDRYRAVLFADNLCVASENVTLEGAPGTEGVHAAALFDIDSREVDFAYNIHERLYPASTTKILTALVALKKGTLTDEVIVSSNADAARFAADESTCGLKAGDRITLKDLLYGLMMQSGNDNAVAIAEHIGGSHEAFVKLMNEQAAELKATNSHFINANGLHNPDHYTTAYDLYLIFNECIKQPEFIDLIQAKEHTAHITGADGVVRDMILEPTNHYASGEASLPANAEIIGGKTGTTKNAGNCLILLEKTPDAKQYISIIMGAQSKDLLYQDMTKVIEAIPAD